MQINGLVLGKYRIEKLINHGSFASVFRAKEEMTNRTVAIKALPKSIYPATRMRYLLTELSAMGMNWGHPNIVSIHTVEPGDDECVAYIVMEYIDGPSLHHLMVDRTLPRALAINIALDICRGLIAAHEHNIIHRDIKPQNILLTSTQVAKISDFGVARILEATNDYAWTITGTRKYMAPEQYQGSYDYRADLYSTGLVLYEMLLGKFPFRGKNHNEIQVKKQCGSFDFNGELSSDLAEFLRKALQPDVKARYQTAAEMYDALDRIRKDWYTNVVEESITNGRETICQATLAKHREDLRLSAEVAEAIELKALYKRRVESEKQRQLELASHVETHYDQAIQSLQLRQPERALREMQQAHRLYLSAAQSTKKADWIFRNLSTTILASAQPATAEEMIDLIRQVPTEELLKLKSWLGRQFPGGASNEACTDSASNISSRDTPSASKSAASKTPGTAPELVLQRLHKVVQNPHEVVAEQIRQEAEDCARQGRDRQARAAYKKLGEFYRKSAAELIWAKDRSLAADCYMRARFAFAAAGREGSSRKSAREAAYYYAEAAARLERQQEWAEAGRLYALSAENYAHAKVPEAAEESRAYATICYFNVAENTYAAGDLHQSFDYCEKTLAIGKLMSRPSKAVTGARKLMEEITMRFAVNQ